VPAARRFEVVGSESIHRRMTARSASSKTRNIGPVSLTRSVVSGLRSAFPGVTDGLDARASIRASGSVRLASSIREPSDRPPSVNPWW
jgi:hypothetical protein